MDGTGSNGSNQSPSSSENKCLQTSCHDQDESNIVEVSMVDKQLRFNGDSNVQAEELISEPSADSNTQEPSGESSCMFNTNVVESVSNANGAGANVSFSSGSFQGSMNPSTISDGENGNNKTQSGTILNSQSIVASRCFMHESSSFSGEQNTFMLDEELELEHTETQKENAPQNKR